MMIRCPGKGKWCYSRSGCPWLSSNSATIISNSQRASPSPSVGPNSNDANTVKDCIDDGSEGLAPHWANGEQHEEDDDSQYNLVVPFDDVLACRRGLVRGSLHPVFGFYHNVEPNGNTPQSPGNTGCAHVCPIHQRSLTKFMVRNLRVMRIHSVSFSTVDSGGHSPKASPSDPSPSARGGCGICTWGARLWGRAI